jgi:hypothetical protein
MRTGTTFVVILFLILLLAFALGAIFTGQDRSSAEYKTEIEALHLETAARVQAIKVGFLGGLAVVTLFGTAGVTAGLVRAIWQRARLIHPHANGLFPVVQGRVGRQTYYHDPNRQLSGSVVYDSAPEGATAHCPTLADDRGEQLQVTTQAQTTQLIAAAGQGQGLTAQSRQLVERVALTTAPRSTSRLPDVVVLDEALPQDRHLLTALRADWDE